MEGCELTANKLNVSQESGDAFAEGNVKATWIGDASEANPAKNGGDGNVNANFGAQGPTHVIAETAEIRAFDAARRRSRGMRGLWQQGNSVAAPVIVLDRTKQTLTAETTRRKESGAGCTGECDGGSSGQTGGTETERAVGDSRARRESEVFGRGAQGGDARGSGGERGFEHRGCDYVFRMKWN